MTKIKVLIIDDDVELCWEMAETLEAEGYLVERTSDPVRGRELIDSQTYDIAIFDYKLPFTTGVDLLRYLKTKSPGTKAFLVTGRPFIEKLVEEEKVGPLLRGIISKPFDSEELLERIKG